MPTIEDLVRLRRACSDGTARQIRIQAALSLAEVANHLEVDLSTVHRWETGKRRPRDDVAGRYLELLDTLAALEEHPGLVA